MYSCLNPQSVVNQYTGDQLYVDCRQCHYCLNKRSYDLAQRIEREFSNPSNGLALLITLDYSNNCLPVYSRQEDGSWCSNRDYTGRYPVIQSLDNYYHPVRHPNPYCFGHLCYSDVSKYFMDVRARFHYLFKRTRQLETIFPFFSYEDIKFRYFLCGEYGPTTFRPHYHIILWFRHRFTAEQSRYISQVLSACWSLGSVDVQACTTSGVRNYVSSYVTSSSGLPEVLRAKSVRPFVTFSKAPSIGSICFDQEEVKRSLNSGIVERYKYDDAKASFVPDVLPSSVFRRYFPKCSGFSYKDDWEQLRIYSYAFNYFKDLGVTHSPDEVDSIRLRDISWPFRLSRLDGKVEWSYLDKYASLVAYRYCVKFNLTPEAVLSSFRRIYLRLAIRSYKTFLDYQENAVYLPYTINHDRSFLADLPQCVDELGCKRDVLESYGVCVDDLYPSGYLDYNYFLSISYVSDPDFIAHSTKCEGFALRGVKQKKINEYKRNLRSNLVVL